MTTHVKQVYEVACSYCGVVERTDNELWADAMARLHQKTHHEQHTEGEGS